MQNEGMIGGENFTVEIDESLFSKRKYNRGRNIPANWVFGAICRETNECFMVPVQNRNARTLLEIISQRIRRGTKIISDEWASYRNLDSIGYIHETVNHSIHFVDPDTGANTQKIESMWARAKSQNKKRHGTHRTMIESYFSEFLWRKKNQNADLFESILRDISICYRIN